MPRRSLSFPAIPLIQSNHFRIEKYAGLAWKFCPDRQPFEVERPKRRPNQERWVGLSQEIPRPRVRVLAALADPAQKRGVNPQYRTLSRSGVIECRHACQTNESPRQADQSDSARLHLVHTYLRVPRQMTGDPQSRRLILLVDGHPLNFSVRDLILRQVKLIFARANISNLKFEKTLGPDVADRALLGQPHRQPSFIRTPEKELHPRGTSSFIAI